MNCVRRVQSDSHTDREPSRRAGRSLAWRESRCAAHGRSADPDCILRFDRRPSSGPGERARGRCIFFVCESMCETFVSESGVGQFS